MNRPANSRRPRRQSERHLEKPAAGKKREKSRPQKLRIIGGKMRGRTVIYHGAEFTRPMKDSVRESLFNIIGPRIKGSVAIDLFAGTGAVAFEALSRGAVNAVAIERNRKAFDFLKSTAKTLDVESSLQVHFGDTYRLAGPLLHPRSDDTAIDDTPRIVFFCPPYAMWESMADELFQLIELSIQHLPPGSLIIAETEKHYDPDQLPGQQWDHRIYGNTRLSVLEPPAICGLRL